MMPSLRRTIGLVGIVLSLTGCAKRETPTGPVLPGGTPTPTATPSPSPTQSPPGQPVCTMFLPDTTTPDQYEINDTHATAKVITMSQEVVGGFHPGDGADWYVLAVDDAGDILSRTLNVQGPVKIKIYGLRPGQDFTNIPESALDGMMMCQFSVGQTPNGPCQAEQSFEANLDTRCHYPPPVKEQHIDRMLFKVTGDKGKSYNLKATFK